MENEDVIVELIVSIIAFIISIFLTMFAWNWVITGMFGTPEIDFGQTCVLVLLCRTLFAPNTIYKKSKN